MAPIRRFYSIKPGESLEEIKTKKGISLCELLDELDRAEDERDCSDGIKNLTFDNLSDEDREAQDLLKKLRGALNKISPENFYIQLMEIQDYIPAHSSHLMNIFVKELVEKAIDEEFYSILYAHVCQALKSIELLEVEDESVYTFGSVVLDKVYNTFCYNRSSLNWFSPNDPTEDEFALLVAKETRKRRKCVATMRFVGDLFKSGMIDVKGVFLYIKKLEQEDNEKNIEALCKLLTTAGKELEASVLQTGFESDWFATWDRILQLSKKERGLPLRQRCLLMNLLDLMNNGWVSRFPSISPKTYNEILLSQNNNGNTKIEENIISNDPLVIATEQTLFSILKSNETANEKINSWEVKNFKGKKTWLVYALTRAVLRISIVGNSLDETVFNSHIPLLSKYVNSRQAEVACMYAVQYFVVSEMGNPKGLLEKICDILHSSGVISYIAFLDWRENWSKSPVLEVNGKAEAQITLATFFVKLFWGSIKPSSRRYTSIVKELNSFDLEHFVSMSKLPPEIGKRIKMEEEREKSELHKRDRDEAAPPLLTKTYLNS